MAMYIYTGLYFHQTALSISDHLFLTSLAKTNFFIFVQNSTNKKQLLSRRVAGVILSQVIKFWNIKPHNQSVFVSSVVISHANSL